jgi:hypothetical protein
MRSCESGVSPLPCITDRHAPALPEGAHPAASGLAPARSTFPATDTAGACLAMPSSMAAPGLLIEAPSALRSGAMTTSHPFSSQDLRYLASGAERSPIRRARMRHGRTIQASARASCRLSAPTASSQRSANAWPDRPVKRRLLSRCRCSVCHPRERVNETSREHRRASDPCPDNTGVVSPATKGLNPQEVVRISRSLPSGANNS